MCAACAAPHPVRQHMFQGNVTPWRSNFILEIFCMKIREVVALLGAEILCGEDHLDTEIHTACGSDMMSDVLAYVKDQSVLLTGLLNPQVVRTAEMMDMLCIVFVRGKRPEQNVVDLAREKGIVLLSTDLRLFVACGILYTHGLGG